MKLEIFFPTFNKKRILKLYYEKRRGKIMKNMTGSKVLFHNVLSKHFSFKANFRVLETCLVTLILLTCHIHYKWKKTQRHRIKIRNNIRKLEHPKSWATSLNPTTILKPT